MEEDGAFDCEVCEYRQQKARLTQADRDTMDLFRDLSCRVVQDLGLQQVVFDVYRGRVLMRPDEVGAVIPIFAAIHDIVSPVKKPDDDPATDSDK